MTHKCYKLIVYSLGKINLAEVTSLEQELGLAPFLNKKLR